MTITMTSAVTGLPSSQPLSLDDYDRIIGQIQDGALETGQLALALDELRGLFQANYVTLILRVPSAESMGITLISGQSEWAGKLAYFRDYRWDAPLGNMPPDQVYSMDQLMSREEWEGSTYYRDYSQPNDVYHIMGANIATTDAGVLGFRITRSPRQPAFCEQDRALCMRLLPHLRRSLHVHNLLGRSESLGNLYAEAVNRLSVASLVLDESGSVLQLNDVARELLAQADGLKLVGSRLEASYPSDNRELHKLIRDAVESKQIPQPRETREALSVARPSGEVSLGVVVEPIAAAEWAEGHGQPAVMLYIRDAVGKSQVDNRVARELFNFTPAETALALQLANGLSLEEAAEELGIMRNTARAHLRAIFSKTGVRRQAELVRVMLNSVGSLGRGASISTLGKPVHVIRRPLLRTV
ncbi:helix-turn-helix transcriptional regulator [Halopseudomonas xiamenensis]|uniref:helix-turn-helix transcriptional regulator n=1 Tax=Halopseudomonas xiamenensis TaxID=157792 RepID=UPI001F1F3AF2|nr:LuxR C-terminal-related transcriptional regulator [Halopseudomonas xiamenensis]